VRALSAKAGWATLLLLSGGCTIVRVEGPARATTAHLGVLRITATGPGAIVYRSAGFGLVPGLHGVTLGAATETVALVPRDDCHIILFGPRIHEAQALAAALAPVVRRRDICSLGEE